MDRKHSLIQKLCIGGVAGLVLLSGIGGMVVLGNKPTADRVTHLIASVLGTRSQPLDRAAIEANARIKLPDNATEIQVHTEQGIDSLILLKFALPPAEIPKFLTASGFQTQLKGGYNPLQWREPNQTTPW